MKLTDTQLVILSHAANRPDHRVLPLPAALRANKPALTRSLNSLIKRELIAEKPAGPGDEIWREADDQPITLVLSPAGLDAIGLAELQDSEPIPEKDAPMNPGAAPGPGSRSSSASKGEAVTALLARPGGASIKDLQAETGWQPHSVRAYLSGLRKKGLTIERNRDEAGKSVYRMEAGDD